MPKEVLPSKLNKIDLFIAIIINSREDVDAIATVAVTNASDPKVMHEYHVHLEWQCLFPLYVYL